MRLPRRTRREGAAVPRADAAQAVHQPRRVPAGLPVAKRDAELGRPAQPTKRPSGQKESVLETAFWLCPPWFGRGRKCKSLSLDKTIEWNDDCRDRL
jgi:hypothetical protein